MQNNILINHTDKNNFKLSLAVYSFTLIYLNFIL